MKKGYDKDNQIIIPPEPYFETFEEGLSKDINDIKNRYESISSTSHFIVDNDVQTNCSLLETIINTNLKLSRQTILFYMSFQPEYSIFNLPSYSTILSNAFKDPAKMYDDSFRRIFTVLRTNFKLFSKIIRKYFSQNLDHLFCFSWLTFPSIFNFFNNDCFIECGYNLIMQFLPNTSKVDTTIADFLLPPFFLCSFEFTTKLWLKISSEISGKTGKNHNFVNLLISSICSCSSLLSHYHKAVIHEFYNIDTNRCITFLIKNFFKVSFEIVSKSDDILFSSFEIVYINKFFSSYSSFMNEEVCGNLIDSFSYQKVENLNVKNRDEEISVGFPKMPDFNDFKQYKSVLSSYDVGVLLEIIDFSEDDEELKKYCYSTVFKRNKEEYFRKGFSPIEIKDVNPNHKVEDKTVVFPKQYQNYWNSLFAEANEKNLDTLDFFNRSFLPKMSHLTFSNNENIEKFVYLHQIYHFQKKYETLNRIFKIRTRIKENEILYNSIQLILQPLFNSYFEQIKNEIFNEMKIQTKIISNEIGFQMNQVFKFVKSKSDIKKVSTFVKFLAFLDSFEIEKDSIYLKLNSCYMDIIKRDQITIQNSMTPYRKAKRILDTFCIKFAINLDQKKIGKKIYVVFKFVNIVFEIDSQLFPNKSKFNTLFKYVICLINYPAFFDAYLISKIVLNKNKFLMKSFDKKNKQIYNLFINVMDEFLGTYKQDLRCLSYIQSC